MDRRREGVFCVGQEKKPSWPTTQDAGGKQAVLVGVGFGGGGEGGCGSGGPERNWLDRKS